MPKCQECAMEFPNRALIKGKIRVLASRKRCTTCSPWGAHNTSKVGSQTKEGTRRCSLCRQVKSEDHFYLCGNGRTYAYCKTCDRSRQSLQKRQLKKAAVAFMGGACVRCGYDRHACGLDFHHTDPSAKDFNLSHYKGGLRKALLPEIVKRELEKCELVCATCHREIHAGIRPFALEKASD